MTKVGRKMHDVMVDTTEKCTWWNEIKCMNGIKESSFIDKISFRKHQVNK